MTIEGTTPTRPAAGLRRVALAAYLSLIGVTLLWEAWLAPKAPLGFWLAVKGVPLLIPLRGLFAAKLRSHVAASLLLMLYLTEGLVLLWTERDQALTLDHALTWALAETLLSLTFIVTAAFWVRAQRAAGARL